MRYRPKRIKKGMEIIGENTNNKNKKIKSLMTLPSTTTYHSNTTTLKLSLPIKTFSKIEHLLSTFTKLESPTLGITTPSHWGVTLPVGNEYYQVRGPGTPECTPARLYRGREIQLGGWERWPLRASIHHDYA